MVKNNLLLSVLVASFAAPVFASFLPKECPLNKQTQFAGAVVAVDVVSSKFTRLPRAIELYSNQASSNIVKQAETPVVKTAVAAQAATSDVDSVVKTVAAGQAVTANSELEQRMKSAASSSFVSKVLDTEVSVDLKTVGVDGGVTVKVAPLAVKAGLTYLLFEAGKRALAFVYPSKK